MRTNTKRNGTMKITPSAFYAKVNFIASQSAESGGALFGYEEDNIIRCFVADENAETTPSSYSMNTDYLNLIIKRKWKNERMSLLGIAHSHPYGSKYLSPQDKEYFEDMLEGMPRKKFYTPIINCIPDGGLDVFAYVYEEGSITPKAVEVELVSEDYQEKQTILKPQELSRELSNNLVFVYPKEERDTYLKDKIKDILIIFLSIGLFVTTLFAISLYIIVPIIINTFLKFIELWN